MLADNKIQNLNKQLLSVHNDPSGLALGKMGTSLYLYHLSYLENSKDYKKLAEKYLDEVFGEIATVKEIDIKNGLTGIGLSIDYLVKNGFVKGNINNILQEIDDY